MVHAPWLGLILLLLLGGGGAEGFNALPEGWCYGLPGLVVVPASVASAWYVALIPLSIVGW